MSEIKRCGGDAVYSNCDNGDVVIRLSGRIASNLRKITDVLNGIDWAAGDDTPADLLAEFVFAAKVSNLADKNEHPLNDCGIAEELNLLCDSIDCGTDDEDESRVRREGLRDALHSAFGVESVSLTPEGKLRRM